MALGILPRIAKSTFGFNSFFIRHLPVQRQMLTIAYHRIGDRNEIWPESSFLVEATLEQFAAQMQWLRQNCTPIDLEQMRRIIFENEPVPPHAVLVTFDDGYRDDLWRILPILQQTKIRPVVFLTTDYVGSLRRYWWDRISVAIQTTTAQRLITNDKSGFSLSLKTPNDRDCAIEVLIRSSKALTTDHKEEFIVGLEKTLNVPCGKDSPYPMVVGWEDARQLNEFIDFGTHTVTHRRLTSLNSSEILTELSKSRQIIEEKLGRPCVSTAIPYGQTGDYPPEILQLSAQANLQLVFSLENTVRLPQVQNQTALVDRLAIQSHGGLPGLAAKITWPKIFIPQWRLHLRNRWNDFWRGE